MDINTQTGTKTPFAEGHRQCIEKASYMKYYLRKWVICNVTLLISGKCVHTVTTGERWGVISVVHVVTRSVVRDNG